jgi:hypothetical protein
MFRPPRLGAAVSLFFFIDSLFLTMPFTFFPAKKVSKTRVPLPKGCFLENKGTAPEGMFPRTVAFSLREKPERSCLSKARNTSQGIVFDLD